MNATLMKDIVELDRLLKASSSTDVSTKTMSLVVEAYLDSIREVQPSNIDLHIASELFVGQLGKVFSAAKFDLVGMNRAAFVKYQSVCIQIGTLLRAETKLYKRS